MAPKLDWVTHVDIPSGPGHTRAPNYEVFNHPIEKSPADDRDYMLIQLKNGLEAMVIHDPKADKAAASMDVAVGHLSDPVSGLDRYW
jgi:insulysin